MSLDIDTDQAGRTASQLEAQQRFIGDVAVEIDQIGLTLNVREHTSPAVTLAADLALELGLVARGLRVCIDMVMAADNGRPIRAYEHSESELESLLRDLAQSLDNGVGAAGSIKDARRHLARVVLGPARVATPAVDVIDGWKWEAQYVTGAVLDAGTPGQARAYWKLLDDNAKDASVVLATASVSDRYLANDIELDQAQVFLLQTIPVPNRGRRPASGPNTDWAGVEIPKVAPADEPEAPESEWAYDQELRSFFGGSVVCSAIQVLSVLPSRPGTDLANGAISAGGIVRDAATVGAPIGTGAASGPGVIAAVAATLVDLGLCRMGVGSGARSTPAGR